MTAFLEFLIPLLGVATALIAIINSSGLRRRWEAEQRKRDLERGRRESRSDRESADGQAIAGYLQALADQLHAQREQDRQQDDERAFREKITIVALIVAGVAGGLSAGLLWVQLGDARRAADTQHADTSDALKIAQTAANAAVTQATSNRAYLFVVYPPPHGIIPFTPVEPLDSRGPWGNARTIQFAVTNYGESPGIITFIETHLIAVPIFDSTEPNPIEPSGTAIGENVKSSLILLPGGGVMNEAGDPPSPGSQRVIVAGKSTSPVMQQNVGFPSVTIPKIIPNDVSRIRNFWLFIRVHYLDIYGNGRETCFYAKLSGMTYIEGQQKYNYWK